jgi:hypothetical protein
MRRFHYTCRVRLAKCPLAGAPDKLGLVEPAEDGAAEGPGWGRHFVPAQAFWMWP